MTQIDIKILGVPEVKVDGNTIVFPYKKAEALFYFLCINKKSTRETLSSLLWGGYNDESARKNLRNAIYIVKNTIASDIIKMPNRSVIELNTNTNINIDIDKLNFCDEGDAECIGKVFLEGFSLKDAYDFEDWLREEREHYQKITIDKLSILINKALNYRDYSKAEGYLQKLIRIDSYNEEAYRQLMKIYKIKGEANKSLECYGKLKAYLDNELGIKPDIATQHLYESIKMDIEMSKPCRKDPTFFGRVNELNLMKEKLGLFKKEKASQCIVVQGEAGVGKSALIEHFIGIAADDNTLVLHSCCYQAEETYCLRPWRIILEQILKKIDKNSIRISPAKWQTLSFFFPMLDAECPITDVDEMVKLNPAKYAYIVEAIVAILKTAMKSQKIFVIIDDIQWADDQSLKLIYELLLKSKSLPVFFILSGRNEKLDKTYRLIHTLYFSNILTVIELNRLTKEETFDFCRFKLNTYRFDIEQLEHIYKETEGNIFFIVEILNLLKEGKEIDGLSYKMHGIMQSRLSTVSKEGLQILNLMSVFFDEVLYSTLQALSGKGQTKLVQIVEELQDKYLIKEDFDSNEQLAYRFTHIKIREYVYSRLSASRAALVHNKVGLFLEDKYSSLGYDDRIITRLIHHFSQGGNRLKELEYYIKRAKIYLCFTHELFPVVEDKAFIEIKDDVLNCNISEKQLQVIEDLVIKIRKTQGNSTALMRMESDFLAMKGSSLIQKGNYEEGMKIVEKMIIKTEAEAHIDNLLKGYTQMCYYGIQTDNKEILGKYSNEMHYLSKKNNMIQEYGMSLRFIGVLKLMEMDFDKAEKYFNESIRIFESIERFDSRYTFSITAALNYIGDTRLYSGRNEEALKLYEKCITLSEGKRNYMSMSLFYANAGHAAFNIYYYELSKKYFEKSLAHLSELNGGWVHSIANSFMALLLAMEGDCEGALHNMKVADASCERLKKKYWIGINDRVKAEIRILMKDDRKIQQCFQDYLAEEACYYAASAASIFESVGNRYEMLLCKKICGI